MEAVYFFETYEGKLLNPTTFNPEDPVPRQSLGGNLNHCFHIVKKKVLLIISSS